MQQNHPWGVQIYHSRLAHQSYVLMVGTLTREKFMQWRDGNHFSLGRASPGLAVQVTAFSLWLKLALFALFQDS